MFLSYLSHDTRSLTSLNFSMLILFSVQAKKERDTEGQNSEDASSTPDEKKEGKDEKKEEKDEKKEEKVISLRPLNMEDLRQAKNQV